MAKKNQSKRLATQHKKSLGVVGVFGENARLHDASVGEVSQLVMEHLNQKFPQLSFRYKTSIKKKK